MNRIAHELSALIKAGPNRFFDTEDLKVALKERSVRGGTVTMTSQAIKFLLYTGSTVVLARLLTPQDYGLIAMVTAITGFVALFKDMGLSMATIQKAEINHSQVSALFWINVAVSFALALILAAGAPIISWFYVEPRLTWIAIALSTTIILSGLAVQHMALLSRQMCFIAIAAIDIGSMGVGIISGVVLAWYGAGYWALVGLPVATALSYAALAWVFCRWRPGLPVRGAGILSMVKFGAQITGFDIVNYFARNLDNILLGRFCGASVLGFYNRAYSIMMLPINQVRGPLNTVAIPALSRLQEDPVRFKKYYMKLISAVAFITMPLMVFLAVCSENVINLILGKQWLEAVPIFRILAIAGFIQPVASTRGVVLLSLKQSGRYLKSGTFSSAILVSAFILGLPWGAIGIATAYAISNYIILLPILWYCFKFTPIELRDFFKSISRPVIASFITVPMLVVIHSLIPNQTDIIIIFCCFIITFIGYLLGWILFPGGFDILRGYFRDLKLLTASGK